MTQMNDIIETLAKVAAAAMIKTAAPADQEQAPAEAQQQAEAPMAQPDVVEQDNMRLQNLLANLQLRADVVKAQRSLEKLQAPKRKAARPMGDPDAPQAEGQSIPQDDMTSAALTSMLQKTPKIKRDLAPREEKKETKQRRKETSKGVDNTADDKADRDRSLTEPVSEPTNES